MILKKIVIFYKEIQGLLVDSIQLIIYIISGINLVYPWLIKILDQPLYFSIGLFIIITVFIFTIIRSIRNIKNTFQYKIEYAIHSSSSYDNKVLKRIINFEKIIPRKMLLVSIKDGIESQFINWSKDFETVHTELWITQKESGNTSMFEADLYSPSKRIKSHVEIKDFQKPDESLLDKSKMYFEDKIFKHKSFFDYPSWRAATLFSLSYVERELMGRHFTCLITMYDRMKIHIMPHYDQAEVEKTFVFYYDGLELKLEDKLIKTF